MLTLLAGIMVSSIGAETACIKDASIGAAAVRVFGAFGLIIDELIRQRAEKPWSLDLKEIAGWGKYAR